MYTSDVGSLARELETLRALLPSDVELVVGGAAALRLDGRLARDGIRLVGDLEEWRATLR